MLSNGKLLIVSLITAKTKTFFQFKSVFLTKKNLLNKQGEFMDKSQISVIFISFQLKSKLIFDQTT